MKVDLHVHTTASDGGVPAAKLVRKARGAGLDVIAVADHDTVAGVDEAIACAPEGLRVIPAIEISAAHEAGELHILGYHVDPEGPALRDYVARAETGRRERMERMIALLGTHGIAVTLEDVVAEAGPDGSTLGRPHLARVLVAHKHVRDFGDAFVRFIGDGGPAYAPTTLVNVEQAIDVIHAAGGLAVWAHPPSTTFDREIERFAAAGMDGVECIRPRHTPAETERLRARTRELGMLVSGGSDWHGPWDGPLGQWWVEAEEVAEILGAGRAA
ncbi:MAG TPA: PHP domain-containing protein [Longimicrobiales bacterium]|nr:PHP domain-containing protein [Longimicrobiales bacterium]